MKKDIKGLTTEEVNKKAEQGKVNKITISTDENIGKIIRKNIFTYFNLIFLIITLLLLATRSYRNLTFLPVIIANVLIGIIQQIRSKITLDKLSLLDKNEYMAIRDGKESKVSSENLVEGDYIILKSGQQIPADGTMISGNISVNESLLTGEQNDVQKNEQDNLMSGSFVTSGEAIIKLTKVGDNSYSAKLMKDSKKIKNEKSEMISSIDNFVKIAGIAIIPIGVLLFTQSYFINKNSLETSVISMVSAVIGMIPEGLYLLTTVALAISTRRLAKEKVLLHDMRSIETLARVDVLCVDKTGTITNNEMKVTDIFTTKNNAVIKTEKKIEGVDDNKQIQQKENEEFKEEIELLRKYVNTIQDENSTMKAMKKYLKGGKKERLDYTEKKEFNSKDKFSYIKTKSVIYKLGAPEILLNNVEKTNEKENTAEMKNESKELNEYSEIINERAKNGERVVAFIKEENGKTYSILFISLKNEIRKNAKEIFKYFKENEVNVKVISGDNPITASNISKQVEIADAEKYIDCSTLKSKKEIKEAANKYTVFGRVTPEQKREIIKALKSTGKKVAMTGDGVNDILAMKEADCSIAMGTGSDAARDVSQVVLLDSDFSKMRNIVYEGRKDINNITRSASLFIYKNMFSFLLALYSIIFMRTYPLKPTQVSLGAAFTIGIPAFLLTLEENQKKQESGNFMKRVLSNAMPAAITSFLAIVFMVEFSTMFGMGEKEISTASAYLFFTGGFLILYRIIRPLNAYRTLIMILCILGIVLTIRFLPGLFAIEEISNRSMGLVTLFAIAEFSAIRWISLLLTKIENRRKTIL